MAQLTGFSSPFLLGFEDIERLLNRVTNSANEGYPPYNVERFAGELDEVATIRITLAVAGFSQLDLDVTVEDNQLLIKGHQAKSTDRDFLHRGIATRHFQRTFVLAEGLKVHAAVLKNGLLAIDLNLPRPQNAVKTIDIRTVD